jgi:F-type H+-transporting ATPase subunit alpha
MELSDEIRKQLNSIYFDNTPKSVGTVTESKDGIVIADGLDSVGIGELVYIEDADTKGMILNIEETEVGIVILDNYQKIKEGQTITSLEKRLSIDVNDQLIGRIIDPLGKPLDDKGKLEKNKSTREMLLERIAPGVIDRENVTRPLETGLKVIDALIPIGKGQRELIIGDRQTGKSAIPMNTILAQKRSYDAGKPVYCIYVMIGQKRANIAHKIAKLEEQGALSYTTFVIADASTPSSLQYLAPYAGTAIGEYFAEKGLDALVIFDDLTKHAWAYREISLLLRRPPGREAYPGDIFYLHSRLLERSLQYSKKKKGGSLTALPIVETLTGDVSAYIPTNIISITDGQIYLEPDLFNSGQRPAVNVGLSVSRVGGDAQIKAMKQVAGQLKLDLAQYRELAAFAQFGSDLDEETKKKLDRGARLMEILKQEDNYSIPLEEQVCIFYAAVNGYLDNIEINKIKMWEERFLTYIQTKGKDILKKILEDEKIEGRLEQEMKKMLEGYKFS